MELNRHTHAGHNLLRSLELHDSLQFILRTCSHAAISFSISSSTAPLQIETTTTPAQPPLPVATVHHEGILFIYLKKQMSLTNYWFEKEKNNFFFNRTELEQFGLKTGIETCRFSMVCMNYKLANSVPSLVLLNIEQNQIVFTQ